MRVHLLHLAHQYMALPNLFFMISPFAFLRRWSLAFEWSFSLASLHKVVPDGLPLYLAVRGLALPVRALLRPMSFLATVIAGIN